MLPPVVLNAQSDFENILAEDVTLKRLLVKLPTYPCLQRVKIFYISMLKSLININKDRKFKN